MRAVSILLVLGGTPLFGQSFNVDVNCGPQPVGSVPSERFGGAADQVGAWNALGLQKGIPLVDLTGAPSGVSLAFVGNCCNCSAESVGPNTRDFASLLNDFTRVGGVFGSFVEYVFEGLQSGSYDIYTYGVRDENPTETLITVDGVTEIVTGPMPGDAFFEGITHAVHRAEVTDGTLAILVEDSPGGLTAFVNGFQIVATHLLVRGDCNDDGIVNIADGIFILNLLFQDGPNGNCQQACDVNADETINIADTVDVAGYLFLNGPPPPPPFPDCGFIPSHAGSCKSNQCP